MGSNSIFGKGLVKFLRKVVEVTGLAITSFLGFETILNTIRGRNEDLLPSAVAFAVLLSFLACVYFAYLWKPTIPESIEAEPSPFLPEMEQLRRRQDFTKREQEKSNRKAYRNRVKRISSFGTVIIPLVISIDLFLWLSVRQSLFWKGLYVAEISSRDVPELVDKCSNTKFRIKINHPDSWSCRTSENPFDQTVFVLQPQQEGFVDSEQVKIVVRSRSISELKGLEPFLTEHIALLREKRFEDFVLLKRNEITVLGQRGYKIEYKAKDDGENMRYVESFALRDLTAYIITYLADEFHFIQYRRVAEEIVDTFDFIDE